MNGQCFPTEGQVTNWYRSSRSDCLILSVKCKDAFFHSTQISSNFQLLTSGKNVQVKWLINLQTYGLKETVKSVLVTPGVRSWFGTLFGPLQTAQRCSCNSEIKKHKWVNTVNNHVDRLLLLFNSNSFAVQSQNILNSVRKKKWWEYKQIYPIKNNDCDIRRFKGSCSIE